MILKHLINRAKNMFARRRIVFKFSERWRKTGQVKSAIYFSFSTRHLSFLETGKAEPSREMILLLGNHLQQTAAPFDDFNIIARLILDGADWPYGQYDEPLSRYAQFLSSVGGGVLAGMSVLLWGIVAPAIKRGDLHVAKMTIWAFVVWYIVDGVGSYASGFPANIAFNTFYLVIILGPLVGFKGEVEKAKRG